MALVQGYNAEELAIAGEFLTTWLPFLSAGLCPSCASSLRARVHALLPPKAEEEEAEAEAPSTPEQLRLDQIEASGWDSDPAPPQHPPFEPSGWDSDPPPPTPTPPQETPPPAEKPKMSWADMAQEDELAAEAAAEDDAAAEEEEAAGRQQHKVQQQLTRDQREQRRYQSLVRKKDYICLERVRGRLVNILEGLELHTGVFSSAEQKRIVDCVYELQERGKRGELGERTYTEPQKWMRGKGRVTIQFGCCYNYATDKNGNPPGIIRTINSDPMPHLLKTMVKRLVRWNVLPTTCVPDSCIVNIYEPGDCIPPHIDSHDFVRPFCTVSFLSECNILFGSSLKVAAPGEFIGSFALPLPVGSVLVINGNGADVAKHCVPAVPAKRISITFRKMDPALRPFSFKDDPELLNIAPLETVVQDAGTGRSSDDVQIRNLNKISRGKRSKGRTAAGKAEAGILGDQTPGHMLGPDSAASSDSAGPSRESRYHSNVPGSQIQSPAPDSAASSDSAGRSRESRYHSNVLGSQSQAHHLKRHGNGMRSSEDGVESRERRPRMELRQISMINRTINDDMESLSIASRQSADRPRSAVRTVSNKPRRTRVILDD